MKELYAWRDEVARNEDESTGFVCPNKLLIQLGKALIAPPFDPIGLMSDSCT